MRVLNETIARMANAEYGCTGRFWEGRFKSQVLLDEQAMLMSMLMSYVDLNPIRAGIAETPEQSAYTSVSQRVDVLSVADDRKKTEENKQASMPIARQAVSHPKGDHLRSETDLQQLSVAPLMPFEPTETLSTVIPFAFDDYLELIDTLS
jgi:hypothetical protein